MRETKELLLVDDVRLFLHLCEELLSREDLNITRAMTGEEALEKIRKKKPDAILLDLYMPGIDGDEVCRQIRSDPETADIPVVMITTESDADGRRRCLYSGCDDFITKPVMADVLKTAISKQLAKKKRSHPRAGVSLPCLLETGQEVLDSTIHTISAGGAYVAVDPPPLPGSIHRLIFTLPEVEEFIIVSALARWNRLLKNIRPAGSGYEFLEVEEGNQQMLSSWVQETISNPVFS
jgi:CheY-like chemotaxis protein